MKELLKRFGKYIAPVALGLALLGIGVVVPSQYVDAAPNAAPTPPSNVVVSNKDANTVVFQASTNTTVSLTTNKQELAQSNLVSYQWVFSTTNNTATIRLQISNNGVNWYDSDLLATAVQSSTGFSIINTVSKYQRLSLAISTSVTSTFEVVGLAK